MTGAEVAWRTLAREKLNEPCIIGAWIMKRAFFQHFAGIENIYRDAVATTVEAIANAGCNLNPQFIMPSPLEEHRACDPANLPVGAEKARAVAQPRSELTPEDIRDEIETLPDPETLSREYDTESTAREYAERLIRLRGLSRDRTLYISGFGMPSFMSGYTRWTYESYLSALYLYPRHLGRHFRFLAEKARLHNMAVARAVKDFDIAPVVYGGDDICFNDGPICSLAMLDELYFPALQCAIEPLVEAGVDIVWHCDGNVLPLVERLIAMGITGFQGFQEREANIPLEKMVRFRRRDGGKLIFFGSISVVHTFPFGTPDDMRSEIERCFNVAAPGGGFCLASTSSILPETPMENIITFMQYGREYGRRFLSRQS